MYEFFVNKVVLVTGAAGSVGQELVRQLLHLNPAEVRALDNNETELFFLGSASGRLTDFPFTWETSGISASLRMSAPA